MFRTLVISGFILAWIYPGSAPAIDWKHWGDGKAEVNHYKGTIERYGQTRPVDDYWIFVTEPFTRDTLVKADEGKHPKENVMQVLKFNGVRTFQTGIYQYRLMTSVFSQIGESLHGAPLPPVKIAVSSQEWCGQMYAEIRRPPMNSKDSNSPTPLHLDEFSYFDGESKRSVELKPTQGKPLYFEDALPIIFHQIEGDLNSTTNTSSFVSSVLTSRLLHTPVKIQEGRIKRGMTKERLTIKVQGRSIPVTKWSAELKNPKDDSALLVEAWVEIPAPHRVLRFKRSDGLDLTLVGSERLPYWEQHGLGDEKWLKSIDKNF